MNEEQEIKKEMSLREQPDSITMTFGTPSKGSQVVLKCYVDMSGDSEIVDKKLNNTLRVRQALMDKGVIIL